jgi:hypothetical protein
MTTWVLLITIFFVVDDPTKLLSRTQRVATVFDTFEECEIERKELNKKMRESYPTDSDFILTCLKRDIKKDKIS